VFETEIGPGPQGDIAIDEIILVRKGNEKPSPTLAQSYGLPQICTFEVSFKFQ